MKIVDLNILLYAVNEQSPHHDQVRSCWEAALAAAEPVGLTWTVLLGFLRLATNPRVFDRPLNADEALERVTAWLAHENTRLVGESPDHWIILRELLRQAGTAGNLTTDAHLAALAIGNGAVLVSCDHDFARFAKLRWENPVAAG